MHAMTQQEDQMLSRCQHPALEFPTFQNCEPIISLYKLLVLRYSSVGTENEHNILGSFVYLHTWKSLILSFNKAAQRARERVLFQEPFLGEYKKQICMRMHLSSASIPLVDFS